MLLTWGLQATPVYHSIITMTGSRECQEELKSKAARRRGTTCALHGDRCCWGVQGHEHRQLRCGHPAKRGAALGCGMGRGRALAEGDGPGEGLEKEHGGGEGPVVPPAVAHPHERPHAVLRQHRVYRHRAQNGGAHGGGRRRRRREEKSRAGVATPRRNERPSFPAVIQ
eukprot:gene792-biopygen918